MKLHSLLFAILLGCTSTCITQAEQIVPIWQLNRDTADVTNDVTENQSQTSDEHREVSIDAERILTLPSQILGSQTDFTIEFEIKRPNQTVPGHAVVLASNASHDAENGFRLIYHPPPYNAAWVMCNGYRTVEKRGFLNSKFNTITLVAHNKQMSIFLNGLILAVTNEVSPSDTPLQFGGALHDTRPPQTYPLRNIRIYDRAIFPTDFDPSLKRMRNYSGDQYMIQRAPIENELLPRILVVGDSISMGYRGFITDHFAGRAHVDYWVGSGVEWYGNDIRAKDAKAAIAWRGVLSHGPYDVITWNAMTLHWWNSQHEVRCPVDTLERNIDDAAGLLEELAPETKVIWVRCTPIRSIRPDGSHTLNNPDNERVKRYNAIVDDVMRKRGIPIVDLNPVASDQLHTIATGSQDTLHWGRETSQMFANKIIVEIENAITEPTLATGAN
ncbi:SGNH/GDSL hydrolase family protein [Rhodopirellula sallentina]|nr:SGNH/GDSL hydrolase family protein [Rhodopirellula sallentina]